MAENTEVRQRDSSRKIENHKQKKAFKLKWFDFASLFGLFFTAVIMYIGYLNGLFDSRAAFIDFTTGLGTTAIFIFIFIQATQVVLPIVPAAITCTAGIVMYGPVLGLLYNYIGIAIGSVCAFLIAKRYGKPLVQKMVREKTFNKYYKWISKGKGFDRLFTVAIFAPISPDDLLCYIAGLSPMSLRKFTVIILLGKPLAITFFSMGWITILNWSGLLN